MATRIDKYIANYNRHSGVDKQLEDGTWIHARPLDFYYGVLTRATGPCGFVG